MLSQKQQDNLIVIGEAVSRVEIVANSGKDYNHPRNRTTYGHTCEIKISDFRQSRDKIYVLPLGLHPKHVLMMDFKALGFPDITGSLTLTRDEAAWLGQNLSEFLEQLDSGRDIVTTRIQKFPR